MDLEHPRFAFRPELHAARPRLAPSARFEGLWSVGDLACLQGPTVAVVGSRAPSDGARQRAERLGHDLARAGICVISGLALGIDAAAHAGALAARGPTVGILGGGHRQFFPRRNRPLAEAICAGGGAVLSPYAPDEPARPGQFLQRNGIVAALADAVVIVEAAARSGALNTASWAGNLGIDVLAFPGDVDRPKAAGCNALIRDGATLVRDASDVLAALGIATASAPGTASSLAVRDDPLEAAIVRALRSGPLSLDEIAAAANASAAPVLSALVTLELCGLVSRRGGAFAAIR